MFIVPVVTLLSGCANYKNVTKNKDNENELQKQTETQKNAQSSISTRGNTLVIWSKGYHWYNYR